MKQDKLIAGLFLILIITATIYKVFLIHSLPIQADELYALARTCNHSIYQTAINCSIDPNKIYKLNELLTVFTPKSQPVNFIQDSLYYLQNFYKLSNHPPLAEILGKLAITNNQIGVINLRYLAFIYWLLSLFVIYFVFKELKIERRNIITTLVIYSTFSLTSLTASFAKAYSLQVLTCWLALLIYLKTAPKINFWVKHLPALLALHAAFLTHYFSVFILLPWFILVDLSKKNFLRALVYSGSLCLYLPIVKMQTQQTSDYFVGRSPILVEIKNLYQLLLNIYGLNFRGPLVYILVIVLIILFIRSKKQRSLLYFFLLSLAPSLMLLAYDVVANKHMLGMVRYSVTTLPFVALIWTLILNNNTFKTVLLSIVLLINMAIPHIVSKQSLNEGALRYSQYTDINNFKEKTLFLIGHYSITLFTLLQGIESRLLGQNPTAALAPSSMNNNVLTDNIYVARIESLNKESLAALITKEKIKNIYVFAGSDKLHPGEKILGDYHYNLINIKYKGEVLMDNRAKFL